VRDGGATAILSALQQAPTRPVTVLTGAESRDHQKRAVSVPPSAGRLAVTIPDSGYCDRGGFAHERLPMAAA